MTLRRKRFCDNPVSSAVLISVTADVGEPVIFFHPRLSHSYSLNRIVNEAPYPGRLKTLVRCCESSFFPWHLYRYVLWFFDYPRTV